MNVWMMWGSPWLLAAGLVGVFLGSVSFGPVALLLLLALFIGGALGQRESLGPLQPGYAVVDSMVSLLVASGRLRKEQDGIWNVDHASRKPFRKEV